MSLDDALRAAGSVVRRRSGRVLPYYALAATTVDVARLPLLLGVAVAALVLASTGRLEPLLDDFAALNPAFLDPAGPTGMPPAVGARLADVLFAPSVVAPLVLGVLVAVAVSVLVRGVTRAAALSAVDAALTARDPLVAGVAGMARWRTFVGLVLVRWGLLLVAGIPLLAAVGGVLTVGLESGASVGAGAPDQQAVVAVLAALVGGLVTVLATLVVLALLAFVGPAAVVDDRPLFDAVRQSARLPVAQPVGFLLYAVVVVGSYVLLGVATFLAGIAGVNRIVPVASAFLVSPLLDGVAVALYAEWTRESEKGVTERAHDESEPDERLAPSTEADESGFVFGDSGVTSERDDGILAAVARSLVDGGRELGRFVKDGWAYVGVSALTLAAGIAAGWTMTAGSGVRIDTPADPASVFGLVPVGPFVNIAVNNWFVASNAGFSGVFAGGPTLGTLLFNGLLVGAVAGVVDPVAFLAFVAPHGVIELPAIAVAGGVGLRLGHVAWGTWRGTRTKSALADELGRTWRLVVGLLVVFVVAGFVEAFVTPQVAAAVL